jgi:hypothetical protein
LHVVQTDTVSLRLAIEAANRASLGPRICLAVSSKTLASIDLAAIEGGHVGLALDDVDATTPLAMILCEGIEVVRFRRDFVAAAERSLRLGCALEAILLLDRNLGLCTLGWPTAYTEGGLTPALEFDYLPSLLASSCPSH